MNERVAALKSMLAKPSLAEERVSTLRHVLRTGKAPEPNVLVEEAEPVPLTRVGHLKALLAVPASAPMAREHKPPPKPDPGEMRRVSELVSRMDARKPKPPIVEERARPEPPPPPVVARVEQIKALMAAPIQERKPEPPVEKVPAVESRVEQLREAIATPPPPSRVDELVAKIKVRRPVVEEKPLASDPAVAEDLAARIDGVSAPKVEPEPPPPVVAKDPFQETLKAMQVQSRELTKAMHLMADAMKIMAAPRKVIRDEYGKMLEIRSEIDR